MKTLITLPMLLFTLVVLTSSTSRDENINLQSCAAPSSSSIYLKDLVTGQLTGLKVVKNRQYSVWITGNVGNQYACMEPGGDYSITQACGDIANIPSVVGVIQINDGNYPIYGEPMTLRIKAHCSVTSYVIVSRFFRVYDN